MAISDSVRVTIEQALEDVVEEFGGSFSWEAVKVFLDEVDSDPEIAAFYEAFYSEAHSDGMADANMER